MRSAAWAVDAHEGASTITAAIKPLNHQRRNKCPDAITDPLLAKRQF